MKTLPVNISVFAIALLSMLNVSCEESFLYEDYKYTAPLNTGDGLETGTPEELNIDTNYLFSAADAVQRGKYGEVHSMLIYTDNKLILEEYFQGHTYQWDAPGHKGENVAWNRETQHCIHSDTKSITIALYWHRHR